MGNRKLQWIGFYILQLPKYSMSLIINLLLIIRLKHSDFHKYLNLLLYYIYIYIYICIWICSRLKFMLLFISFHFLQKSHQKLLGYKVCSHFYRFIFLAWICFLALILRDQNFICHNLLEFQIKKIRQQCFQNITPKTKATS